MPSSRRISARLLGAVISVFTLSLVPGAADATNPSWQPPAGAVPSSGTYVYLESQPGDFIGRGRTYLYTLGDSLINVSQDHGIGVAVNGDENWSGYFRVPESYQRAEAGYYPGVQRSSTDPSKGSMDFSGEGRGCNTLSGWFSIDGITYDAQGSLEDVTLRFEQHCESAQPALWGKIHWNRHDTPTYPDPGPPPNWQPPAGLIPPAGTVLYLKSDPGDYIGQGGTYFYTDFLPFDEVEPLEPVDALLDSSIEVQEQEGLVSLQVKGIEEWQGNFKLPDRYERAEKGYFPGLQRYPFHNPVKGGLDFDGEGRGCNKLAGWFSIDEIAYATSGSLERIVLRFEQRCGNGSAALRGKLQWGRGPTSWIPAAN